jgi:hypothetical protein
VGAFAYWMQSNGYRPATIQHTVRTLKAVARRSNLLEPEQVKEYLGKAEVSENRKIKICEDLDRFYNWKGIPFQKPKYTRIEKLPFIPLETEVNAVIAGVGKKTSCFLQLLKETGMRCGEAYNMKWVDLDLEKGIINVIPEKHSHARQLKVSPRLIAMLNNLQRKWPYVFRNPKILKENSLHVFRRHYIEQRKKVADKLQNPRINAITFHTLRHFDFLVKPRPGEEPFTEGKPNASVWESVGLLPPQHGATPKMQPISDDTEEELLRKRAVDSLPSETNGQINRKYLGDESPSQLGQTVYATVGDSTKPRGVTEVAGTYSPYGEASNDNSNIYKHLGQKRDHMHSEADVSKLDGLFALSDSSLRVQDAFISKRILSGALHYQFCIVHS